MKKTRKINWKPLTAFTAVMVLAAVGLVGCGDDTPEPLKATITVPTITAIANPMNFGPVSAYTGWDSNFAHTDVTYTLSLDGVLKPAGTTEISADGLSNGQHTIVQTFSYKGNPITGGSRSGVLDVGFNMFLSMIDDFNELALSLSKPAN